MTSDTDVSLKAARQKRVVLIAGPTASGKSALALGLATRSGGVVINADAMQVYRPLHILTARPDDEAQAAAPHVLYGHVAADVAYSVAQWRLEAEEAIVDAWARGLLPIVVGGTGLYFTALEKGLADIPPIPDEVRSRWRQALREQGSIALHGELARRAPDHARLLRPSDSQRIVRALEVLEATGRSLIDWQRSAAAGAGLLAEAEVARCVLVPDRKVLHDRINRRFAAMVEQGALEEVRRFIALNLPADAPVYKAIGIAELARVLDGEIGLADAIVLAQARTRQFAKRQLTWFRHQMAGWPNMDPDDREAVDAFIRNMVDQQAG